MNSTTWRGRYALRIMAVAHCLEAEALMHAEAVDEQTIADYDSLGETPEDAADDEMESWSAD